MARADRRRFLQVFAALLGAAVAAAAALPVFGSLLTPLLRKKEDERGLIKTCPEKELIVGVPKRVELVSTLVDGWTRTVGVVGAAWLLKDAEGKISALSSVCPHSGCSISQQSKTAYSCPCHKSLFTLDGAATEGPSPRPMDPLPIEVKEGAVWVKWVRYKVGIKERTAL